MQEITRDVVKGLLPKRDADTNKGSFGSVLAVAGSMAYRGAASLCVEGALRGGAGLVYLASVEPVLQLVLALALPAVLVPFSSTYPSKSG